MKQLLAVLFPPRRPLRWVLPLAVLVGLVLLQCLAPQWAGRAEDWTVDTRFLLRGPETPRNPIVIVAIDEDSVQSLGDDLMGQNVRTWPRANWARLISRIAAGQPRLIVLDVVFDIPGWDAGGDDALAAAIKAAGNVVLAANWDEREVAGSNLRILSPPVDVLAQAAAGVGIVNFPLDADGAVRRLTLLYPYADKSYPALALVVAVLYQGAPVDVPPADLGSDLSLLLHIRGPQETFTNIPMDQVWFEEVDPQTWRDAIVLVGYTTKLEQDRHLVPFSREVRMPGVEVHANAVDTLLAGDWLHRVPDWLPPVLVGALGLLALVALSLRRPWVGLVATGGALLLYLLAAYLSFAHADLLLPVVAPVLSAVLVAGSAQAERMIFAEREKRLMRRRFAGVMSAERLQAVMDNWEDLQRPERRLKPAAVLFADIRNFTHATETLMAQERTGEMVAFLTAYLDAMAEAVFAEGGVIYRMMGDGLLILFGLPEALPDYTLCAVRGALRMAQAAEQLRDRWPLQGDMEFGMGIGLNAGLMTDGIVGTGRQLDYSVIGDAVNTAARIEAHCKVAMEMPRPAGGTVPADVTILLGWDLYEQVRDAVLGDENIPPFAARGKSDPVRVVRLLGLR